jgi:hypothetical protein
MQKVDERTVQVLEGTAPGACSADYTFLLGELRGGRIFANFSDTEREELWSQVCTVSRRCLIPSLHTFFEDLKFLKNAAACIKRLMQLGPRDTLTGRLEQIFNDIEQEQDRCIIQVSESSYITISGHSAARLDLGCRQLWLAAFRDYQDLPPEFRKLVVQANALTSLTTNPPKL